MATLPSAPCPPARQRSWSAGAARRQSAASGRSIHWLHSSDRGGNGGGYRGLGAACEQAEEAALLCVRHIIQEQVIWQLWGTGGWQVVA